MVFKNLCILLLWMKVEGSNILYLVCGEHFSSFFLAINGLMYAKRILGYHPLRVYVHSFALSCNRISDGVRWAYSIHTNTHK